MTHYMARTGRIPTACGKSPESVAEANDDRTREAGAVTCAKCLTLLVSAFDSLTTIHDVTRDTYH